MIITIVAFQDDQPNSVTYRKFNTRTLGSIDKAIEFYRKQIENPNVRVISTRKVEEK